MDDDDLLLSEEEAKELEQAAEQRRRINEYWQQSREAEANAKEVAARSYWSKRR